MPSGRRNRYTTIHTDIMYFFVRCPYNFLIFMLQEVLLNRPGSPHITLTITPFLFHPPYHIPILLRDSTLYLSTRFPSFFQVFRQKSALTLVDIFKLKPSYAANKKIVILKSLAGKKIQLPLYYISCKKISYK